MRSVEACHPRVGGANRPVGEGGEGAVYGRFADKEALALASALLPDELTFADLEATLRAVYRRGISAEIGSTEAELLRSAS